MLTFDEVAELLDCIVDELPLITMSWDNIMFIQY